MSTDDEWAPYRPHGPCAHCGEHPATEPWFVRIRGLEGSYEGRCVCCAALGELERAHETLARTMKRIPELEKAALKAQQECGKEIVAVESTD